MSAPIKHTILVTGANGYIGQHIVKTALEQGHAVRATARSEASLSKLRAAFPAAAVSSSQLSTALVADLADPTSYEHALDESITAVIHAASPFILNPTDLRTDVLDPAIAGSVAILEATARYAPNAKSVVVTSSLAAMADPSLGLRPGYTYTDKDWNPMTYEQAANSSPVPAYVASKALAEKAMWTWMDSHKPSFSLTAINPAWVYGPTVNTPPDLKNLGTSLAILWSLVGAEAVPPTDFPAFVDVRDVALAHVRAVERAGGNDEAVAGKRFLTATHSDYQTLVDLIRDEFPELRDRVPVGRPGYGATEAAYAVDGRAVTEVLGVEYTPLRETVRDTFRVFIEAERAAEAAA